MCIDASRQLSAFNCEATPRAPVVAVVLSGEMKYNVEPFSKEDCEGVMTHIDGISLFLELDLFSAEEMFAARPVEDIAGRKELAGQMFTEFGGLLVFTETDLDTHQYVERALESGSSKPIELIFTQQFYSNSTTLTFPWDPGNWLWVLLLMTSDQVLCFADLNCWSGHFSISWCDMWTGCLWRMECIQQQILYWNSCNLCPTTSYPRTLFRFALRNILPFRKCSMEVKSGCVYIIPPFSLLPATQILAMESADKYYRQIQCNATAQLKCCMLHHIRELTISTFTSFPLALHCGTVARMVRALLYAMEDGFKVFKSVFWEYQGNDGPIMYRPLQTLFPDSSLIMWHSAASEIWYLPFLYPSNIVDVIQVREVEMDMCIVEEEHASNVLFQQPKKSTMHIEIFYSIWLLQVRSGTACAIVIIHHGGPMLLGSDRQEFSYCFRNCQQRMDESSVSKAHINLYRQVPRNNMSLDADLDETLFLSGCKKFTSLSVLAVVLMVQCRADIILALYSGHGRRHGEYELYKCSDYCSFNGSGCYIQYKQWDLGMCYFRLQYMSKSSIHKLCNPTRLDGMPWDPVVVHGSCVHPLLGDKQCFLGAVLSHPVPWARWAWMSWATDMAIMGWLVLVDANKRRSCTGERYRRIELKSGCSHSSLSRPLPLRWPLSTSGDLSGGRSPQAALSLSSRSGDLR